MEGQPRRNESWRLVASATRPSIESVGDDPVGRADVREAAVSIVGARHAPLGSSERLARNRDLWSERSCEEERKIVTVMSVDVVGSTTLSGQMDPETSVG